VMLAFYLAKNPRKTLSLVHPKSFGIVIAGLFLAANYFSYMRGLELTTASNAQIMIQLGPLALLFVGVFYFKESMRLYQWIGVGIASVGFLMFYWDQLLISMEDRYSLGNSWIIIGAFTWAVFAAIQKYYVQ